MLIYLVEQSYRLDRDICPYNFSCITNDQLTRSEWIRSSKSIANCGLDLGAKEAEDSLKPLVERIQTALGERVKAVRVTHCLTASPPHRLTDSPAASSPAKAT
jgi:HSP90 family molecular chaperone